MIWLDPTKPYYTPDPVVKIDTGAPYRTQQTIASALQEVVREMLNTPAEFTNGGEGVGGPDQLVKDFVAFALMLAAQPFRSMTDPMIDAVALANHYAGVVIDTLKQIRYGADGQVSVYDAWIASGK